MPELRMFIAETDGAWTELTELTEGERQVVRLSAPNLQEAARRRRKLPADVAVVLDLAVSVADDPRTALAAISYHDGEEGARYAGTVDGLAGLVADLVVAGVADGVTLIPVGPDDLRPWAYAALSRIQDRLRIRAA
jgi:hypothetical protein